MRVRVDHQPLLGLFKGAEPKGRIARWGTILL